MWFCRNKTNRSAPKPKREQSNWLYYNFSKKNFCELLGLPANTHIVSISQDLYSNKITITCLEK